MNIPPVLLVVLVGLAPIGVFASLIIVPSNVKWQPPLIWETKFGNATALVKNGITGLAADKTGVYAVGFHGDVFPPYGFYSTPSFDFIKKFDFTGREVWSQQPDNLNITKFETISIGPDGLYVSGIHWANDTVFVQKHDLSGNTVWVKEFRNISTYSWGVSVGDSGVYVAGLASGFGTNGSVPVIMRNYDLNGNVLWTKTLSNETAFGPLLVFASSNSVYFAGSDEAPSRPPVVDTHAFIARYDASGVQLWKRQFYTAPSSWCACVPYGLSSDSSGIYLSGATYDNFGLSGGSAFLRKYDLNGNVVWANGQSGGKLSADPSGLYSLGRYLERYDPINGNRVWSVETQGRIADYAVGRNGVYTGGSVAPSEGTKALLVGYDQSASLVLGGVNPPYSFLILGAFPGVAVIGVLLVRRSSKVKNPLHSEGELPDTTISEQRRDTAGQWWVERQLAQRASENDPRLNKDKDNANDDAGSEDHKSS